MEFRKGIDKINVFWYTVNNHDYGTINRRIPLQGKSCSKVARLLETQVQN